MARYYGTNIVSSGLSVFTQAQIDAINSGIDSTVVSIYNNHVNNTIHVTSSDKTNWSAKQDTIIGKANKFDNITLSEIPGIGRVAKEDEKIIVKALENSDNENEKLVLCVTKFNLD